MRIVLITAGGAGMFCGSCMQDNTLARALRMAGADALLLPTYTPIRVDEEDATSTRVFLGGINVYLDSKVPGWRFLPQVAKQWLDRPGLVRVLSKLSSTDASKLGPLTIDLLRGTHGPQRAEIRELIRFLCHELKPDLILFSNALLSGVVPELRQQFSGRLCCLLQGDDVFLDGLPPSWRSQAISLIQENSAHFEGLFTHSQYYSNLMQQTLNLPAERFRRIPLTIEEQPPDLKSGLGPKSNDDSVTVGYFARICPEKGAFRFLDAAEQVLPLRDDLRMMISGFLPEQHRRSFERRFKQVQHSIPNRLKWIPSPASRVEKFELLQKFDWLCVPGIYQEPKGLYVLEAALAGVPSIMPAHGALPERIEALGAGALFDPLNPSALNNFLMGLNRPSIDPLQLRNRCLEVHGMAQTGVRVLESLRSVL